jgi:hypothetical protein
VPLTFLLWWYDLFSAVQLLIVYSYLQSPSPSLSPLAPFYCYFLSFYFLLFKLLHSPTPSGKRLLVVSLSSPAWKKVAVSLENGVRGGWGNPVTHSFPHPPCDEVLAALNEQSDYIRVCVCVCVRACACACACVCVCVCVCACMCVHTLGDARLQTCSVVIAGICSGWQARLCQRGCVCVLTRVWMLVASTRAEPACAPTASPHSLETRGCLLAPLACAQRAPCCFYRNQHSAGPLRLQPAREHAQCKPLVWLGSRFPVSGMRDSRELPGSWADRLCVQREETVAWPHPGSPAAGTMLACLTRGNLLDVLQEGFNEVTALLLPPPAPGHPAPPA